MTFLRGNDEKHQTPFTTQLTEPIKLPGHPPPRHQPPSTILPFMPFMRFMLRLLSHLTAPQTHPGQAPQVRQVSPSEN